MAKILHSGRRLVNLRSTKEKQKQKGNKRKNKNRCLVTKLTYEIRF